MKPLKQSKMATFPALRIKIVAFLFSVYLHVYVSLYILELSGHTVPTGRELPTY